MTKSKRLLVAFEGDYRLFQRITDADCSEVTLFDIDCDCSFDFRSPQGKALIS
jgi:hypothetical protein